MVKIDLNMWLHSLHHFLSVHQIAIQVSARTERVRRPCNMRLGSHTRICKVRGHMETMQLRVSQMAMAVAMAVAMVVAMSWSWLWRWPWRWPGGGHGGSH